ncbi:MAG TPA: hypothetical protein EYP04_05460 [Anaerolineae bacterium]|nr:hypothetical protein [Anaerolineae bacterium]
MSIALTTEEVIGAVTRRGRQPAPALVEATEEAIALGQNLWQPAAVYGWFNVRGVLGEQLELSVDHVALTIGPHADLLAPAKRVMVAVYTIGPALEREVSELERAGESLLAYMLDSAGVMALGIVGEAVRHVVEAEAAAQTWGVSPALAPGSLVGWSLQGQEALCALIPVEDIGVLLNGYGVLVPHKSGSVLIGMGPGYRATRVGSVCHLCALANTCWRRRDN